MGIALENGLIHHASPVLNKRTDRSPPRIKKEGILDLSFILQDGTCVETR
jgi:hypothetical protein